MLGFLIPGANVLSAAGTAFSLFVRFATSTIGMVLIALVIGYGAGHHQAKKACNAAKLQSQLAAAKADLAAADKAADLAQDQAAELEAADRANQEKVNGLEVDLATRPDRKCGLSRGDALRLRNIR